MTEKEKNEDAIRAAVRTLLTTAPPPRPSSKSGSRNHSAWARPHASEALGVNPKQIPEATQALRASGVMADFDKQGRLLVTSDNQFRKAAKSCGLWTGRDGYGGGQTEDGHRVMTGRELEHRKQEFRAAVARGDYDS